MRSRTMIISTYFCGLVIPFCLFLLTTAWDTTTTVVSAQSSYDYDNNANDDADYFNDANYQQQSGTADGGDEYGSGQNYYSDGGGGGGGNDDLYANYAAHQQEKLLSGMGGAGGPKGGGGGFGVFQLAFGCGVSWFLGGKYHSDRVSKKLKLKFHKEQKQLYTQYYNDVYKLSEKNSELQSYTEVLKDTLSQTEAKHELEAIQRDYDEFKQPDIDGDDRISRAEFNMYVKNYLANYPGLTEADYPKFEDFDHDHDGFVSFTEYAQQMALQAQKAELEQMYGSTGSGGGGAATQKQKDKNKAYQDMYESSVGSAKTKMYR